MTPHRFSVLNGLSLALLGLALSACDTAPTQVDQHFGMAVRQARTQQTLQPDARPCADGQSLTRCRLPTAPPMRQSMHDKMHPDASTQRPGQHRGAMPMPMPMPMQPGMHERHHPASVDTDGPSAQAAIER